MTKWEKLEIDNLPPDILTGDYEFELRMGKDLWEHGFTFLDVIRYRIPEPKEPTHEEIMSKWWRVDDLMFSKVANYQQLSNVYFIENLWQPKSWFTGRESADIPPEHKT